MGAWYFGVNVREILQCCWKLRGAREDARRMVQEGVEVGGLAVAGEVNEVEMAFCLVALQAEGHGWIL